MLDANSPDVYLHVKLLPRIMRRWRNESFLSRHRERVSALIRKQWARIYMRDCLEFWIAECNAGGGSDDDDYVNDGQASQEGVGGSKHAVDESEVGGQLPCSSGN